MREKHHPINMKTKDRFVFVPVCTSKYKMRVKEPLNKHKQLKNGFDLVHVCTSKYKMRVKALSHTHKQLKIGLFWCPFVHQSTRCD